MAWKTSCRYARCGSALAYFHGVEKFFPWRGKNVKNVAATLALARSLAQLLAVRYRPRVRHASGKPDFGSALGYFHGVENGVFLGRWKMSRRSRKTRKNE
ncbi:MAG: hypothetical protein GX803_00510 [Lentisphaerae bacterium]|jgi:hypothetical protein|nr:hypothetical protein [Lentisphaerota bacterium]